MQVLSVAPSSSGSIIIPFCPQWVGIAPGAAGTITSVAGRTLGVGQSIDLDSTGVNILGRPRIGGSFVGSNRMWLIPTADGVIKDKTLQLDLTTGAGGTVVCYALGRREGKVPYINARTTTTIGTALSIKNFFACGSDTTSTDNITVVGRPLFEGEKALTHNITPAELIAMANLFSNASTGAQWDIALLDNWSQDWDEIIFQTIAARTVYYTKAAL